MEVYNAGDDCVAFLRPYLSNFIPFVLSLLSGEFSSAICNSAMEILASTAEMSPSLMQTLFLEEMKNAAKVLLELMERIPGDALDRDFWNADVEDDDHELEQIHIVAEDALDRIGVAIGAYFWLDKRDISRWLIFLPLFLMFRRAKHPSSSVRADSLHASISRLEEEIRSYERDRHTCRRQHQAVQDRYRRHHAVSVPSAMSLYLADHKCKFSGSFSRSLQIPIQD